MASTVNLTDVLTPPQSPLDSQEWEWPLPPKIYGQHPWRSSKEEEEEKEEWFDPNIPPYQPPVRTEDAEQELKKLRSKIQAARRRHRHNRRERERKEKEEDEKQRKLALERYAQKWLSNGLNEHYGDAVLMAEGDQWNPEDVLDQAEVRKERREFPRKKG